MCPPPHPGSHEKKVKATAGRLSLGYHFNRFIHGHRKQKENYKNQKHVWVLTQKYFRLLSSQCKDSHRLRKHTYPNNETHKKQNLCMHDNEGNNYCTAEGGETHKVQVTTS